MEAMSNLCGNNKFLKSISKVFQLLICFNLKLTSGYSFRLLFVFFLITPLLLSVNLMSVQSCS